MSGTTKETFWVALCWGRVLAGPVPGGPAWLFVEQAHAATYVAQLRASGVQAEVRSFQPHGDPVLEWQGTRLLQIPPLPPPAFPAAGTSPTVVAEPVNGDAHAANGTPLAPPPNAE